MKGYFLARKTSTPAKALAHRNAVAIMQMAVRAGRRGELPSYKELYERQLR